jgi:hypothetical protein
MTQSIRTVWQISLGGFSKLVARRRVTRRKSAFCPRLEALEGRLTPSAPAPPAGPFKVITDKDAGDGKIIDGSLRQAINDVNNGTVT